MVRSSEKFRIMIMKLIMFQTENHHNKHHRQGREKIHRTAFFRIDVKTTNEPRSHSQAFIVDSRKLFVRIDTKND